MSETTRVHTPLPPAQVAAWLEGQLVREYPMFGLPVGRYFGGATGAGTWALMRNLQRKTPGPEMRVTLEPQPAGGTLIAITTRENEAVARGHTIVLGCWLGFLALVAIPMGLSEPGPHAHPIVPFPVLAVLVVLVLGGASVGVYLGARAIRGASVVRTRREEIEHFVTALRATPV